MIDSYFGLNCFARSKYCQVFYWIWQFYPTHKQTTTSLCGRAILGTVRLLCHRGAGDFWEGVNFMEMVFFRRGGWG